LIPSVVTLPVLPGNLQIVRFLDPLLHIKVFNVFFFFDAGKKICFLAF
jgi:hypothetical protein